MSVDEYWAAVRRLGLRPHTGNVHVTSTGDFYRVPNPTDMTEAQRSDTIDMLKSIMGIAPPSGRFFN
jgi:hypothetical protein